MKTGLMVFPRTSNDTKIIYDIIELSDLYAEYHSEGFFFFEEEESNYDELEREIIELFNKYDIKYRIEGIF